MKIILASASPRRRELLTQMGVTFEVRPSVGEEVITKTKPQEVVQELAYQKAKEIAKAVKAEMAEGAEAKPAEAVRIIGADTIVVYGDTIFGKPKDREDAYEMLSLFQGNTHQVYTGVCVIDLIDGTQMENTFAEKTDVIMNPVSREELELYLDSDEWRDKAGGYGIQGAWGKFIQGIDGDYYNVVGLPMARLYKECFRIV